jgi:hypothetical protein
MDGEPGSKERGKGWDGVDKSSLGGYSHTGFGQHIPEIANMKKLFYCV